MHNLMRSFIIHMSSSTARQANAERLCAELPNAELFEAVNGRDPDQISDVRVHPGNLHWPHYPFPLMPTEVGVFQSHRRIWQKMVDENIDMAIITEDDLRIDPIQLQQILALLKREATPDHYIRIPVKQREISAHTVAEENGLRLVLPWVVGLQCVCQMVGRRAAARMLAATDQIDRPVDTFLQMHWLTGQPVHTLLGSRNQEIAREIGGSTIQKRPPLSDKLTREFKRAAYRAKLYSFPQRPAVSPSHKYPRGESRL